MPVLFRLVPFQLDNFQLDNFQLARLMKRSGRNCAADVAGFQIGSGQYMADNNEGDGQFSARQARAEMVVDPSNIPRRVTLKLS